MDWIEARVSKQGLTSMKQIMKKKLGKWEAKKKKTNNPAYTVHWIMCWGRKQGNEKDDYTSVKIFTLEYEPWHLEWCPCVFMHAWTRTSVLGNLVHVHLHLCTFFHETKADWVEEKGTQMSPKVFGGKRRRSEWDKIRAGLTVFLTV